MNKVPSLRIGSGILCLVYLVNLVFVTIREDMASFVTGWEQFLLLMSMAFLFALSLILDVSSPQGSADAVDSP
jgi:hypothetical protein